MNDATRLDEEINLGRICCVCGQGQCDLHYLNHKAHQKQALPLFGHIDGLFSRHFFRDALEVVDLHEALGRW